VHAQVFRHEDPLLLGVDYFDAEAELTTPNVMEAWVNRAMVKASSMVAAVCESTKFMAQPVKDCGCDSGPSRDHRSASTEEAADALGNMNIKLTLALHWGPAYCPCDHFTSRTFSAGTNVVGILPVMTTLRLFEVVIASRPMAVICSV
jgi:hypothetical protein